MAHPVHELLLLRPLMLIAVVCCLLLQLHVSECSRPSSPSPADHGDDHPLHHNKLLMLDDAEARTAGPPTSTEEVAGDGRTAGAADAAPSSSASATPARAVGTVASPWPRQTASDDRALVRAGMLLRSKLARRFLGGAGVDEAAGSATDGTGASCHSYNPHINCPPASKP